MSLLVPTLLVLFLAAGSLLLSWIYFRRYRIARPPVGMIGIWDVAMVLVSVVLVPYLDLILPLWLVAGLLMTGALSAIYFLWEPVLPRRWQLWALLVLIGGADVLAAVLGTPGNPVFRLINDLALVMLVVGVANLWAQGGLRARDAAILVSAIAVYDLIATGMLPVTADLVARIAKLPFQPVLAWPLATPGAWVGIGMGDLLLAGMFPLVLRKAFGRAAGVVALAGSLVVIGILFALAFIRPTSGYFPVMVLLGPLMVLQYVYWRRRRGRERTTWQYLQAEPIRQNP